MIRKWRGRRNVVLFQRNRSCRLRRGLNRSELNRSGLNRSGLNRNGLNGNGLNGSDRLSVCRRWNHLRLRCRLIVNARLCRMSVRLNDGRLRWRRLFLTLE